MEHLIDFLEALSVPTQALLLTAIAFFLLGSLIAIFLWNGWVGLGIVLFATVYCAILNAMVE